MKRGLYLTALMIMLTACTFDKAGNAAAEIKELYNRVQTLQAVAEVTAKGEKYDYEFELEWSYDKDTGSRVTVRSPESVAGISAVTADGALTMSYDDAVLSVPLGDGYAYSPIEVLPICLREFSQGIISDKCIERFGEESVLTITYENEQAGRTVRARFDTELLTPVSCDVYRDGQLICSIAYNSFELRGVSDG